MILNDKLIKPIMVEHEIAGVRRASAFRNPLADKRTDTDLVNRIFTADGPNRLWLTDVTEHPTKESEVYYCCVVLDCFVRTAVSRTPPGPTKPEARRADNHAFGSRRELHFLRVQ
ncbi:hypothetical protein [Arthrobacter roseus]|uniref:hypothetical protein n=1 Tax=Arthrobacter roseus TaxID=136274 RepID=UPI001962E1A2|nr:hypothetical protein [Arthrobacter roseus]MBM7846786.1 transposase InsO family protein [Arthrobacter roseus]